MAAIPLLEEMSGSPSAPLIASLAESGGQADGYSTLETLADHRPPRRLAIYPASAGFDLVEELDHLCGRTVEPNVFFNPRFLAPAMPRLEDREVRLAVIRDEDDTRSRLRLLVPFSVERPAIPLGVSVLRVWSSPFGPLGTPLLDRDDPVGVIEDFLSMLARPHLKMPRVLVLPDLPLDGQAASLLRTAALGRNLPIVSAQPVERPFLQSPLDGDAYLKNALRAHHYREFRRLKRRLADHGELSYDVLRHPDAVREGAEEFLTLEASGWKGRERTAMAIDRFRAAFAREAIHRLAELDMCRIHTLRLDGRAIASLVVFVEQGIAYTWKTAFDETLSAYSPGTLLTIEATRTHLEDPNIMATDSCAVPDHPVMSRLWSERRRVGTLLIGLTPGADKAVRQAAGQLHLARETHNFARLVRSRVKNLIRRR